MDAQTEYDTLTSELEKIEFVWHEASITLGNDHQVTKMLWDQVNEQERKIAPIMEILMVGMVTGPGPNHGQY